VNYHLARDIHGWDGVYGWMVSEDGKHTFATLEHSYCVNGVWLPKVAPGTYLCKLYLSPKFGYHVFMLSGVPDFQAKAVDEIEIHDGDFYNDSNGCILVGLSRGAHCIQESRKAFQQFMASQGSATTFILTIE